MENTDKQMEALEDDCVLIEKHISIVDLDATKYRDDLDEGEIECSPEAVPLPDDPEKPDEESDEALTHMSMLSEEYKEASPLIVLSFRDDETYGRFHKTVTELLNQLDHNIVIEKRDDQLMISVNEKPEEASFTIDTTPMKGKLSLDIPKYEVSLEEALDDDEVQRELRANKAQMRKRQTCFNCDGNHNLRDCKKPRNMDRINESRKAMGPPAKMGRYHCDIEQKFGHIVPGILSQGLRNALALKQHELPAHIYQMRTLGYPPGWLEQHRVSHSGINLFDSIGNPVHEENKSEEGEVGVIKDLFDIDKIIDYPGFNTSAHPNTIDEAKYYNAPPMSSEHSKVSMIYALRDNAVKGYKRKKLKNIIIPGTTDKHEITDMDIEDNNGEMTLQQQCLAMQANPVVAPPESFKINLPNSTEEAQPQPPASSQDDSIIVIEDTPQKPRANPNKNNDDELSTSLIELQNEHKKLLAELQTMPTDSPKPPVDDSLIDEIMELDRTTDSTTNEGDRPETPMSDKQKMSEDSIAMPSPNARARTKEITKGTPLLKPVSPFETLPSGDKWCVGVSDVINFENLPDSTGKYEQMKNIIGKVRKVVKQINDEDD